MQLVALAPVLAALVAPGMCAAVQTPMALTAPAKNFTFQVSVLRLFLGCISRISFIDFPKKIASAFRLLSTDSDHHRILLLGRSFRRPYHPPGHRAQLWSAR